MLITAPEKYHGKIVQVSGFLNLEFEGDELYLHKEDFKEGLFKNGLWVNFSKAQERDTALNKSGHYITLTGRFNKDNLGHMSLNSGSIEEVSDVRATLLRD